MFLNISFLRITLKMFLNVTFLRITLKMFLNIHFLRIIGYKNAWKESVIFLREKLKMRIC